MKVVLANKGWCKPYTKSICEEHLGVSNRRAKTLVGLDGFNPLLIIALCTKWPLFRQFGWYHEVILSSHFYGDERFFYYLRFIYYRR